MLIEQSRNIQPFADDHSQEDLGHLFMLEGDCEGIQILPQSRFAAVRAIAQAAQPIR